MLCDPARPKWPILYVNDAWVAATGVSADSALSAGGFWELFRPVEVEDGSTSVTVNAPGGAPLPSVDSWLRQQQHGAAQQGQRGAARPGGAHEEVAAPGSTYLLPPKPPPQHAQQAQQQQQEGGGEEGQGLEEEPDTQMQALAVQAMARARCSFFARVARRPPAGGASGLSPGCGSGGGSSPTYSAGSFSGLAAGGQPAAAAELRVEFKPSGTAEHLSPNCPHIGELPATSPALSHLPAWPSLCAASSLVAATPQPLAAAILFCQPPCSALASQPSTPFSPQASPALCLPGRATSLLLRAARAATARRRGRAAATAAGSSSTSASSRRSRRSSRRSWRRSRGTTLLPSPPTAGLAPLRTWRRHGPGRGPTVPPPQSPHAQGLAPQTLGCPCPTTLGQPLGRGWAPVASPRPTAPPLAPARPAWPRR